MLFKQATSTTFNGYRPGDICHELWCQSWHVHTLNRSQAWIGCGLCRSLTTHQTWTSCIALGLHTTAYRCQMWDALIGRSLHIAHPTFAGTTQICKGFCISLNHNWAWTARITLDIQNTVSDFGYLLPQSPLACTSINLRRACPSCIHFGLYNT